MVLRNKPGGIVDHIDNLCLRPCKWVVYRNKYRKFSFGEGGTGTGLLASGANVHVHFKYRKVLFCGLEKWHYIKSQALGFHSEVLC